jgi:hypothetical protein
MGKRVPPTWIAGCFALVGFASLGLVAAQPLQPAAESNTVSTPAPEPPKANIVRQGFPAGIADPKNLKKSDTAWEIEWTITNPDNKPGGMNRTPASVLAIRQAKFMYKDRNGRPRWISVVKNLELGEMFVPYDTTKPTFLDVSQHSFFIIPAKKEYLGPNCVTAGEILGSEDPRMANKVMKEVHDDGLRWLDGKNAARRGEKMMLWAIFYGGNYRYLIEYTFQDDGVITARVGATGHNFFRRQEDQRDVHLHAGCWRFDPDLSDPADPGAGGPDKNIIRLVRRVPNQAPGTFRIEVNPFNPGPNGESTEGAANWVADEFTILRMESTVRKNGNDKPHPTAYDLIPLRYGSVRHFQNVYEFANRDFWVTRTDPAHTTFARVPKYVEGRRPVDRTPATIWHISAAIHVARAEDFGPDGLTNGSGVALTTWAGFILRPRNLFDSTPLYPTPKK